MKNKFGIAVLASMALALAGCQSSLSNSAYTRSQVRSVQTVQTGTVESVRDVLIEGTKSGVGTAAGAIAGGVGGRNVGGGSGRIVGSLAGAVVGGLIGSAVEESTTRRPGLEITVRMDNGQMLAVTQEADEYFRVGDRVRLLEDARGAARVSH